MWMSEDAKLTVLGILVWIVLHLPFFGGDNELL